ncbi:MAG: toxin-antitoxin system HicB family antitoxin [Chloroflexi bacterium]|nr:toxin-antitoxin system HicB family antitoxin [Chloroflexota bacterium]
MKQLIARVDERLHRRLKARARSEGRSLNALVTDLLAAGVRTDDQRTLVRARLRELGVLYEPPRPRGPVPSLDQIIKRGRGAGTAVSDALRWDRSR